MECNRDEALRAKEIAERKFIAKDIRSAKKFALKAQTLYPGLDGISQMLATFDVYLSAESKTSGETDWYAILSVNASADDETIKKQYRKLALILHPDKNKTVGADGAFKLLSEAWSILSDRGRRSQYDLKTNFRGVSRKSSQPNKDASNGFYNFATASSRTQKSSTSHATQPPAPPPPRSQPASTTQSSSRQSKQNTFWTACNRCKMQYEYLRVYLNHNLLCPSCHEPFLALEIGLPANGSASSTPWSSSRQQNHYHGSSVKAAVGNNSATTGSSGGSRGYCPGAVHDSLNHTNFQWGAFSRSAGAASATASSSAAVHAANMVHHTYEKVRKEREEAQAAAKKAEDQKKINLSKRGSSGTVEGQSDGCPNNVSKKRKGIDDNTAADSGLQDAEQSPGLNRSVPDSGKANGFSRSTAKYNLNRELSLNELRAMLFEKSKKALGRTIGEVNSVKANAEGDKKVRPKESDISAANGGPCDVAKRDSRVDGSKNQIAKEDSPVESNGASDTEEAGHVSITYPDPDFHDFDKDRSEQCFQPSQVWAAYDDDDGMPRFYALIHNIISVKPFKMQFSWLNSKTNSELGPLNWVACGFAKSCGEFRVGRYEVCDSVNIFSHKVTWEKGVRGIVKVFPRKGEVWAIYRNWAADWNENTPDEVVHKYNMVEILEDYNEAEGVLVAPLVKVAGFKTVFHRHMDQKEMKRIPREEMFQLSHQVPSWLLTGEEGVTAPKGFLELDPASTPLDLLQVITETKEEIEVAAIIQELSVG